MPGVVSAVNCGIRSCSADAGIAVPVVQVVAWVSCWRRVPTVQTVQKTGEIPQVLFLDTVETPTTTGAWVTTVQKTVEFPQLQCSQGGRCPCLCSSSTGIDVPVLMQRRWVSRWRCLRLSSSPELVDIPVAETVGFVGGFVVAM